MSTGHAVQNPFPGLRPFRSRDSTFFFGRDEQTGEALDRLLHRRLLAVVGVSGCGKSSLVAAGMIPAMEMGLAGDPELTWRVATMRPGDGPLAELARCLRFAGGTLPDRTYGLLEAAETNLEAGENLLLVVDQFEEIFSFRERAAREGAGSEADLFVSYLLRAAEDPSGRVVVLLTMRSDYLGECARFTGLPEALNDGQYLVPRMTRHQLQEAIEGPLVAVGAEIHPALVQDLLNRCDEEPDNLPLLQHLLRRIFEQWEADGALGPITPAMAKSVGGLAKALDADAETVFKGLSAEHGLVAEALFRRITESRGADWESDDRPVRRPQTIVDLAMLAQTSETDLQTIVSRFEDRGLLVRRQTDRGVIVDLPHECLCLKWQRLKGWVRAETEDAKRLRFLIDAVGKSYVTGLALGEALEWQDGGRFETGWCLRYLTPDQLKAVVTWVAESQRRVDEAAENDRVRQEERRREAEERTRRARLTAAILAIALLIAVAFGAYAFSKRSEAESLRSEAERQRGEARKQAELANASAARAESERRKAEDSAQIAEGARKLADQSRSAEKRQADLATSGHLATEALLDREIPHDVAALLSIEAMKAADGLEARIALLVSLETSSDQRLGQPLEGHTGSVRSVAFNPDGRILASGSDDGTVRLWDPDHRQPLGETLKGHTRGVNSVAFSPDGKTLASGSTDQTVQLWDALRRRPLGDPLKGHTRSVNSVAFSPDGKILASGSADQTILLWDLVRRQPLANLNARAGSINSVAFSPDGKLLASANGNGTVVLWNVGQGSPIGNPLRGHVNAVLSVAFSPDGKILASGGADGTVRLWDAGAQRTLAEPLNANHGFILSVAFSPDGKTLAAGGIDQMVRLWDVGRRQEFGQPLKGHANRVNSVVFSLRSKLLASGSDDRTVMIWNIDPLSWATILCGLAQENLSIDEWRRFMGPGIAYRRTCPNLPPGNEGSPAQKTLPP